MSQNHKSMYSTHRDLPSPFLTHPQNYIFKYLGDSPTILATTIAIAIAIAIVLLRKNSRLHCPLYSKLEGIIYGSHSWGDFFL